MYAVTKIRQVEAKYSAETNSYQVIPIEIFVQVGLPQETEEDLKITLRFCESLTEQYGATMSPLYFCPIHGAPLRDDFINENPESVNLPDLVMGLMGTHKKDFLKANLMADRYYQAFLDLNKKALSNRIRRF